MENEKNINWLKNNLYNTVKEFSEQYIEKENISSKYSALEVISKILNSGNISAQLNELNEQILVAYGIDGQKIIDELGGILFNLESYQKKASNDEFSMEEKEKLLSKINSFKLMNDKQMILVKMQVEQIDSKYPFALYKKYRSIISSFKYEQIIDATDLEIIKKYFDIKQLTDVEQIKLLEYIKLNNARISRNRGALHSKALNGKEVLRLINIGFPIYEKPYIASADVARRIDAESLSYLNAILNMTDISEFLNSLDISNYSYTEKQRMISNIINGIQDKLIELRQLISSKDFYLDIDIRDEIIRDYNTLSKKCQLIDEYYENIEDLAIPQTKNPKNILIFLSPLQSNQEKTYFEKDLSKIPKEFLAIFHRLIENYRYGLIEGEPFSASNTNYNKFFKLKDHGHRTNRGKSRIVCRKIKDNYCLILGAIVKKDQSGNSEYDSVVNRYMEIPLTEDLIAENEKVLQRILKYLEENKIESKKTSSEMGTGKNR